MSLPIIAIGARGGKIVGYDKMHNPIYQGSAAAKKLAAEHDTEAGEFGFPELLDGLHAAFGVSSQDWPGGRHLLSIRVAADKVPQDGAKLDSLKKALESRLYSAIATIKSGLETVGQVVVKMAPDGSIVAGILMAPDGNEVSEWSLDEEVPVEAVVAPAKVAASKLVPFGKVDVNLETILGSAVVVHDSWAGAQLAFNQTIQFQHGNGSMYALETSADPSALCQVTVHVPAGAVHHELAEGVANYKTIMGPKDVKDVVLSAPKTLVFDTTQEALVYIAGWKKTASGKLFSEVGALYLPADGATYTYKPNKPSTLALHSDFGFGETPHDLQVHDHSTKPVPAEVVAPTPEEIGKKVLDELAVDLPPEIQGDLVFKDIGTFGAWATDGVVIEKAPSLDGAWLTAEQTVAVHDLAVNQQILQLGKDASKNSPFGNLTDFPMTIKQVVVKGADALGHKLVNVEDDSGVVSVLSSVPQFFEKDGVVTVVPQYFLSQEGSGVVVHLAPEDLDFSKPIDAQAGEALVLKPSGKMKWLAAHLQSEPVLAQSMKVENAGESLTITAADGTFNAQVAVEKDGVDYTINGGTVFDGAMGIAKILQTKVKKALDAIAADATMHDNWGAPAEPVEHVKSAETIQAPKPPENLKPAVHAWPQHKIGETPTNWPTWAQDYPPGTVVKHVDAKGNQWAVEFHAADLEFAGPDAHPIEIVATNLSSTEVMHTGLNPYQAAKILDDGVANVDPKDPAFQEVVHQFLSGLPIVVDAKGKTHLDTIPEKVEISLLGDDHDIVHPEDLAKFQAAHKDVTATGAVALPESEVQNVIKPLKKAGAGLPEFLQQMSGAVQWKWQVETNGESAVVQLNTWFAKGTYGKPIVAGLPNPQTWGDAGVSVLVHEDCSLTIEHNGQTWSFAPYLAKKEEGKGAELAKQLGWGSEWHLTQDETQEAPPAPKAAAGKPSFASHAQAATHIFQTIDTVKWNIAGPDGTTDKPVKINTWSKKGSYAPDQGKGLTPPYLWTDQTVDVYEGNNELQFVVNDKGKSWTFTPVASKADIAKMQGLLDQIGAPSSEENVAAPQVLDVPKGYTYDGLAEHDSLAAIAQLKSGDTLAPGYWKAALLDALPLWTAVSHEDTAWTKTLNGWTNAIGEPLSVGSALTITTMGKLPEPPMLKADEAHNPLVGVTVPTGEPGLLQAMPFGTVLEYKNGTTVEKLPAGWKVLHKDGTSGPMLKLDFTSSEPLKVKTNPLNVEPPVGNFKVGELLPNKPEAFEALPVGTMIEFIPDLSNIANGVQLIKGEDGWPGTTNAALATGVAVPVYLPKGNHPKPNLKWHHGDLVPKSEVALFYLPIGTTVAVGDEHWVHVDIDTWESAAWETTGAPKTMKAKELALVSEPIVYAADDNLNAHQVAKKDSLEPEVVVPPAQPQNDDWEPMESIALTPGEFMPSDWTTKLLPIGTTLSKPMGDGQKLVAKKLGVNTWEIKVGDAEIPAPADDDHMQMTFSLDPEISPPWTFDGIFKPGQESATSAQAPSADVQIQKALDTFVDGGTFLTVMDAKIKAMVEVKKTVADTLYVKFYGATYPLKEEIKKAFPGVSFDNANLQWTAVVGSASEVATKLLALHDGLTNKSKVVLHSDTVDLLKAAVGQAPTTPAPVEPKPVETVVPDEHHVPTSAPAAIVETLLAHPGKWKVKAPGKMKASTLSIADWIAASAWETPAAIKANKSKVGYSTLPKPAHWETYVQDDKMKLWVEDGVIHAVKTYGMSDPMTWKEWTFEPVGGPKVKANVHQASIAYLKPGSAQAKAANKGVKPLQAAVLDNVPAPVVVVTKAAEPPPAGNSQKFDLHGALGHWGYDVIHSGPIDLDVTKYEPGKGNVPAGKQTVEAVIAAVPEDVTPLAGELMLLAAGVPTKMAGQHMVKRLPCLLDPDTGKWKVVEPGTVGAVEKHCFVIDKKRFDTSKSVTLVTDAHLGEAPFESVPDAVKEYASHTGVSYHGLVKIVSKIDNPVTGVHAGDELFVIVGKNNMAVFDASGKMLEDYPVALGKIVTGKPNLIREVFDKHIGLKNLAGENWQKFVTVLHAGSLKVPEVPQVVQDAVHNEFVIPAQKAINEGQISVHAANASGGPGTVYGVPLAKEPWQAYVAFGQDGEPAALYDNGGNVVAKGKAEVLALGNWPDKMSIFQSAGTNVSQHKYEPPPGKDGTVVAGEIAHLGISTDDSGAFVSDVPLDELFGRTEHSLDDVEMNGEAGFHMAAPLTQTGTARVHTIKRLDGQVINRLSMSLGYGFHDKLQKAAVSAPGAISKSTGTAFVYDGKLGHFKEISSAKQHPMATKSPSGTNVPRTFYEGTVSVDGHQVGFRVYTTKTDTEVSFDFPHGTGKTIRAAAQSALVELLKKGGQGDTADKCDVLAPVQDGDLFRKFMAVRRFHANDLAVKSTAYSYSTSFSKYGKNLSLHDVIAGHAKVTAADIEKAVQASSDAQKAAAAPMKVTSYNGSVNYYFDLSDHADMKTFFLKTGAGSIEYAGVDRVADVLKYGLLSARDRYSHSGATYQAGASVSSDCSGGDSDTVYMRPMNGHGSGTMSSLGGNISILVNPAVLGDALFTKTTHDAFGSPDSQASGTHGVSINETVEACKNDSTTEALTRSVPPSMFMAIAVPSGYRQKTIDHLKSSGHAVINGIPVEDFIIEQTTVTSAKSHVKKTYHAATSSSKKVKLAA